jgi:hypothetical protein
MTGSIGKHAEKKITHEKALVKKHDPHPQPAQKAQPTAKPMANADIFSPVPMSSQGGALRAKAVGDATLKALKN